MEILTSQLPSGGYGYEFPSVVLKPFTFLEMTEYLENVPSDPLEKYLYDLRVLTTEDRNIRFCYMMDADFLIFYKKLISVSGDKKYNMSITCPKCGATIKSVIDIDKDVHFKQIDPKVMNGAYIELCGHKYETTVPTVEDFIKVFSKILKYRKVTDLGLIKTIALIKDFDLNSNQVESDVLNATHEDITLLMALRELYYDNLEPIEVYCKNCTDEGGRRTSVAINVQSLVVDFFRDLCINCPIDGTKIVFK